MSKVEFPTLGIGNVNIMPLQRFAST